MTIIRRVVSAARPTVNTFFETLSTELTNTVDIILGKSSEGEDKSLLAILLAPAALHRQQAHFHRHGELITRTSFLGRASASRLMLTARARDGHTTWRWPATVPARAPGSRDSGPPAPAPARPATGRAPPAPDRAREGNSQRCQRLGRQPHSIPRVTAHGKELREHRCGQPVSRQATLSQSTTQMRHQLQLVGRGIRPIPEPNL